MLTFKNYHPTPWRESTSQPISSISGDTTTSPCRQGIFAYHLPESASCGKCSSKGPACCLRGQIGSQGWQGLGIATGIIGKLDRNGLCRSLGNGAIQLLNGPLSFLVLVKPDEPDTLGEALKKKTTKTGTKKREPKNGN
jgi:hypothetical protein